MLRSTQACTQSAGLEMEDNEDKKTGLWLVLAAPAASRPGKEKWGLEWLR